MRITPEIKRSYSRRLKEKAKPTPAERIGNVIAEIKTNGFSTAKPFSIGKVEQRMSRYAAANGITLGGNKLYMSATQIAHTMRDTKANKGLAVAESDLIGFPKSRMKMDLYWDGDCFIYTDHKTKYIIHPNYVMKIRGKKRRKVNFVTAGKVTDTRDFVRPKYRKM